MLLSLLALLAVVVVVLLTGRCFILNMRAAEAGRLHENARAYAGYNVYRAAEQRRNTPPLVRSPGGSTGRTVNLTKPAPPRAQSRSGGGYTPSRRNDDDLYAGASAGIATPSFDYGDYSGAGGSSGYGGGHVSHDSGSYGGSCDTGSYSSGDSGGYSGGDSGGSFGGGCD